jgi:hypothetical protein
LVLRMDIPNREQGGETFCTRETCKDTRCNQQYRERSREWGSSRFLHFSRSHNFYQILVRICQWINNTLSENERKRFCLGWDQC